MRRKQPKKEDNMQAGTVFYLGDPEHARICAVFVTARTQNEGHRKVKLKPVDPSQAQGGLAFGYAKIEPWYIPPDEEYDESALSRTPSEAYHKMLDLYTERYKEALDTVHHISFQIDLVRNKLAVIDAASALKYKVGSRVWAIVKPEDGDLDVYKERIDKVNPDDPYTPYHYTACWHEGWISAADVFDVRADAVKECQRRLHARCERLCADLMLPHDYEEDDD